MPTTQLTQTISAAVVPVVIISACGLLSLAFYNRLAAIVSRLRTFQRERLQERERNEASTQNDQHLLRHLELQTKRVQGRAKLIRLTLLFLLITIALLIGCSLMLALSVVAPRATYVAIVLFALGMTCMLGSTITAAIELKDALEPVELESEFVAEVLKEDGSPNLGRSKRVEAILNAEQNLARSYE
jgi:hypothetical protein